MQQVGAKTIFSEQRALQILGSGAVLLAAINLDILRRDDDFEIRFVHQQYQEYFAARAWLTESPITFDRAKRPYLSSDPMHSTKYVDWIAHLAPRHQIQERRRSGWEETALMAMQMSGLEQDFVIGLSEVEPIEAAKWAFAGQGCQ